MNEEDINMMKNLEANSQEVMDRVEEFSKSLMIEYKLDHKALCALYSYIFAKEFVRSGMHEINLEFSFNLIRISVELGRGEGNE